MMLVRIGIDIGGTKVRVGVVESDGNVLRLSPKLDVTKYSKGEMLIDDIIQMIHDILLPNEELVGIGIGSPGPLDAERRRVLDTPNLTILQHYPLVEHFEKQFNCPIKLNNDANVFALGEANYGAAKGHRFVYGITLGTGFGNAFIWDGQILDGSTGTATEFGNAPYGEYEFEDFLSGRGLERCYTHFSGKKATGPEIYELASAGDELALSAWSEVGKALGTALIFIQKLLDPSIVVVGGSLAAGMKFMEPALWDVLLPRQWEAQKKSFKIVQSILGDSAPIVGAAALISLSD
jgi:glucokinase